MGRLHDLTRRLARSIEATAHPKITQYYRFAAKSPTVWPGKIGALAANKV
jgi:hypothetical protein